MVLLRERRCRERNRSPEAVASTDQHVPKSGKHTEGNAKSTLPGASLRSSWENTLGKNFGEKNITIAFFLLFKNVIRPFFFFNAKPVLNDFFLRAVPIGVGVPWTNFTARIRRSQTFT